MSSGYQVVLYTDDNLGGASLTVTANNSCLVNNALGTGNWNDKTTSLRVQAATPSFSKQLETEAVRALHARRHDQRRADAEPPLH